jgi:hypothetical protein
MDLAPVPNLKRVHAKEKDLIAQIQEVHQMTTQNLQESTTKYKAIADKKRKAVEFDEGYFVWTVLTKDCFPIGEYNKLAACKIGPIEIIEKINSNAYWLKLNSNIRTSDVSNGKHLVLFTDDSSDEDLNSRANSLQLEEDDVYPDKCKFLKKIRADVSVVSNNLSEKRSDEKRSKSKSGEAILESIGDWGSRTREAIRIEIGRSDPNRSREKRSEKI